MSEDIYKVLNDIEINIGEFEKDAFTEIERKKAMKNFRKSIKTNTRYKKYAGVAAALVVSVGVLSSVPVFAGTNLVMHSIAEFLGIQKSLDSYTTVIHQAITKGDITIQLNEVILDGKDLIVSTTIKNKEPLEEMGAHASASVYVNGKRMSWGAGGSSKQIDAYTVEEVMYYHLEKEYTGKMDMTLVFDDVTVNDTTQRGKWKFEFTTNGEELAVNTTNKEINKTVTLPDQKTVTFTRYAINDVGEKIYFASSKEGADYDLQLRGTDNLGNLIVFNLSNQKGTEGVFKLDTLSSIKDETASSYMLELYAVKFPEESGKLSNDFKKVGDAFTIPLK